MWEREEVDVALGAKELKILRPSVSVIDQHPGHQMMRWIAMVLDAGLDAHDRVASVGADDDAWNVTNFAPSMAQTHFGICSGLDLDAVDAAQERCATRDRFGIEEVAHIRMAHAKRRLESDALEGGQIHSLRFREFGIYVVTKRNVSLQMMTAGIEKKLVQPKPLGLGDTPRREPFAANMIDMHRGFFEDGRRDPFAGEHAGKRTPADSSTDDNDFRIVGGAHGFFTQAHKR